MGMDALLARVLRPCHGKSLYRFSNADGKTWLMPSKNMRTAMNLYQPSGRNGKLLKALFPSLHWLSPVRKAIHAETVQCGLDEGLHGLLSATFNEDSFEYAIFCGTPCAHQKLTMQLSKGNRILGYCKISDSEEIARMFGNEAKILNCLSENGVTGIPRCLFHGEWQDGIYLFVQSTIKTNRSAVLHSWCDLHDEFLARLEKATEVNLPFEDSDYYRTLRNLQEHIEWLPSAEAREIVSLALQEVMEKLKGTSCDYSAYHADFTPWNMFVEHGELFVFDWEYAKMSYPPGLDRYHFFTQIAIFEWHWGAKEIVNYINSTDAKWMDVECYKLYLLDIISRFTMRERGNFHGDEARTMNIWISLLNDVKLFE